MTLTRNPTLESKLANALAQKLPKGVSIQSNLNILKDGKVIHAFLGINTDSPNSAHSHHRLTWDGGLSADLDMEQPERTMAGKSSSRFGSLAQVIEGVTSRVRAVHCTARRKARNDI